MTTALYFAIAGAALLLALVTFVQLLYFESLRLRTRELASVKFFKETLEERLKMKAELGAVSFSLIKHVLLLLTGILMLAVLDPAGGTLPRIGQAVLISAILTLAAAYGTPQVLLRRTQGAWLLPLAPFLRWLALAARPAVALLGFLQSLVELTDQPKVAEEQPSPAENIDALITAGAEEGILEETDRKLIQSVVEFGDTLVREVMTPRPSMVAIAVGSTLEQLRQLVIHEQYSRIPVYENSIDEIIGFVHARDMFELDEEERARRSVRELMRPLRLVPETKPVKDLMREMQQDGSHMVIVVDEYGNTAGLATMEDLVEVILGEIRDEHEPDSDVKPDGEGGYIVSGSFDLARLDELVQYRPEQDIESTTIGGLVSELLGHVPQPGETVQSDGIRIEILAGDDLRVGQVRVSKAQPVGNG